MTTRSPLARDEYDRVPENSGSDAPQKNGLRHLPRKVVGVLAACVVFAGSGRSNVRHETGPIASRCAGSQRFPSINT